MPPMDHRQQVESLPQTAKRTSTQTRRGTIARVASRSTHDQHLRDLARLRCVRDRVLATKDLDGVFERLQATNADIVQEPTEQPYGIRDCAVRDPAGTMIRIQE
jgi:hypothetical protein